VLFATIETILFGWVFGIEKAWEEIHHGAELKIPDIYKFIIRYVTPLFLFFILGFWFFQQGIPTILMKGISEADKPYVLGIRLMLLGMFLTLGILVKIAWKKRSSRGKKI
ncbi:sodium:calcium symporter, partial [Candidatus Omnitrophota bacterium]